MLSPVEQALDAAVEAGRAVDLSGAADPVVRADVLRGLLVDGGARPLRLTGARVVGRLDLEGARIGGAVRLLQCEFTEPVWLRGADLPLLDLRRSRLVSLSLTDATLGRVLLLTGIQVADGLTLDGARVGATCSLQGATLHNEDGPALLADRLRLSSELLLDRLVAEGSGQRGAVRLQGARIDGRISGHGMRISNPSGPALLADSMQVTDTVYLSDGSVLRGRGERGAVRIVGAKVGSLSLGEARLENPTGWALAAHYLEVTGTLYLNRVEATGGIRLSGGRIGGQVDLTGARVDGGALPALAATRLQVAQAVVLDGAVLRSAGERPTVDLRSVRIAGDLGMRGTRVANPGGVAVRLNTATVEGRAVLDQLVVEAGGLDLRDSTVGALHDDPASALPEADGFVEVTGLVYRGLPGHPDVTVRERLAWLRRMPEYAAQPYRQLAAAYQAAGHPEDGRRVLIAQQEHLRASGALTGWSRLRHRLFGLTLQYGYQPLRAVALLALTLLLAVGLFLTLTDGTAAQPAGGRCAAVDRVGLAIDTAVPLVQTGADARCAPRTGTGAGQALVAAGWLLTLAGWGSATLVVAGYTGLVRRA